MFSITETKTTDLNTLGTLYAAQFWAQLEKERPQVHGELEAGQFGEVLQWLRERIHARGREIPSEDLCQQLTGSTLDHQPLIDYLHAKMGDIYGLSPASA